MPGRISPEFYVLQIVKLRRLRNPVSPRLILRDMNERWLAARRMLKNQTRARFSAPPA